MARELFPFFPAAVRPPETDAAPPLCTEMAWDFQTDSPILRGGEPARVAGAEAVRVWAWNALKTVRYRWEMFSFQYGCELKRLVGQPFAAETKRAEAARYIQEALLASPYITQVDVDGLELEGSRLTAAVTITTIYGEVHLDV